MAKLDRNNGTNFIEEDIAQKRGKISLESLPCEYHEILIPYSEIDSEEALIDKGNAYGIIEYCTKTKGFINISYAGVKRRPFRCEDDDGKSVIFYPSQLIIHPKGRYLNTKDNIYLVRYGTKGTVINHRSGKAHPAIDYSVPVTILKEYPKSLCSELSIQENGLLYREELHAKMGFERSLDKIASALESTIATTGFFMAPKFRSVAEKAGMLNFRKYADSIEAFINNFLPKFEVKKNETIRGTRYPGIIIIRGSWPILENEVSAVSQRSLDNKEQELCELQRLFEEGDYFGYLRSPQLAGINFCDLPRSYQEMTLTCASRILFQEDTKPVTLSLFQKELIDSINGRAFHKKWATDAGTYPDEIMESCAQNSWKGLVYPENSREINSVLSSVRKCTQQNNNYKGLFIRFSLCYDRLTPCLFLLRIVTALSENKRTEPFRDYCQIVKDMQPNQRNTWSTTQKLFCLPNLIRGLLTVFPETEFPTNLLSTIASTYVDCNCFDDFGEVLDIMNQHDSEVGRLWALYCNADRCSREDIAKLLKGSGSIQLFQKTVALMWDRFSDNVVLPDSFLNILAWIFIADNYNSADEFLRYHYTNTFTKYHKTLQLFASLNRICELLPLHSDLYTLATYITHVVSEDASVKIIASDYDSLASTVDAHGETLYSEHRKALYHLSFEYRFSVCPQFKVFRFDFTNSTKLQADYTAWYLANRDTLPYSEEAYKEELHTLYDAGLYDTYIALYMQFSTQQVNGPTDETLFEKFILAHVNLRRFVEATQFLNNAPIPAELKRNLTIRTLTENFRVNTLTEKAIEIFSDTFSVDMAERILMEQLRDKGNPSLAILTVNSLIPIYCYRGDFCKAVYLLQIYRTRAENGYARLYSKIRNMLPDTVLGKIHNLYDVIEMSFFALNAEDLLSFIKWTKLIPVPDYKEANHEHTFSIFYDRLIDDAENHLYWENFLSHISKRPNINMWQIVVCETIIKKLVGKADMPLSAAAISRILTQVETKKLPFNLLPFVFPFVMEYQEDVLCDRLLHKLLQPEVANRLFVLNPWRSTYSNTYRDFTAFALKQFTDTGEEKYSILLEALPENKAITDTETLSQYAGALQLAVSRLCSNYLNNAGIHASVEFLNNLDRRQLSYRDGQLVDLLSLLFGEDERLQEQYPQLFSRETEVRRLKSDCASILSTYPQKDGLLAFERNCINPTYKMMVYSFAFRVLYDEDIYHLPAYFLSSLDISDRHTFYAYAYFMRTVLLSQLQWNTAYSHFYKVWRYLKLYICEVLINTVDHADDSFIVDAMIQYDYYETTFRSEYVPFQSDVNSFLRLVNLPLQVKQCLLAALMSGSVTWFLEDHADLIGALTLKEKAVIRRLTSRLDYREASLAIYNKYSDSILNRDIENAISVGNAFSEHIVAALRALKTTEFDNSRDIGRLWSILSTAKPADCIRRAMNAEPSFFRKYSSVLAPVMFSRQFSFHLYQRIRDSILTKRNDPEGMNYVLNQFEYCASYYDQSGNQHAKKVLLYLSAFRYCLQSKRREAQDILSSVEIESAIPVQWLFELKRIHNFAFGISEEFHPIAIDDSSQTARMTNTQYTFVQMLKEKLGLPQQRLSYDAASNIARAYEDTERPRHERLRDGVTLLLNHGDNRKISESIPSNDVLILDLGLVALKTEGILSADEQLTIATELFDGYYGTISGKDKKTETKFQELLDTYKMILNRNLSLESWVYRAESIRRYLTATREAGDFVNMVEHVLLPCQILLDTNCSNENRFSKYHELLEKLKLIRSVYAGKIEALIRKELETIASGVRLQISLEKDKTGSVISTDGHVYYQIENIGVKTALLTNVHILFQQGGLRPQAIRATEQSGLTELQCSLMTGGRLRLTPIAATDSIQISLRLTDATTKQVLSDVSEIVILRKSREHFTLNEDHKYSYTGKNESMDPNMLFGRHKQKRDIYSRLSKTGIATIYGPSRIGKTSLLNWVDKDASEKGKILTVLFGGEGGLGKGRDYTESFAGERFSNIPYSNNNEMSDYLLAQTIIHALTDMTDRLNRDPTELLSHNDLYQIVGILRNNGLSVVQRYSEVNKILEKAQVELWLMLDEFQDVVQQWSNITLSCDFVQVCHRLQHNRNPIAQIKLIFCGSDDLLRHMALEDKSVWRDTLWDSRIPVGPLDEEDFHRMMEEDRGISGSNIIYSEKALHSLFTYTGGVALYGKEIGNVIISNIKSSSKDYQDRNTIYVSDVATATQQLLTQQNRELASEIKEGIREIYDAVTKNLKYETDKQYLWYIAKWLHDNPEHDKFPESTFTGRRLREGETTLKNSLAIAVERKILKYEESGVGRHKLYTFCTIFYYNAFLGTFDGNLQEDLIFAADPSPTDEGKPQKENPAETIRRLWPDLGEYDQNFTIGGMATSAKSSEARKALKEISGSLHQGDVIGRDKIEEQNVHITVQNISNTLNAVIQAGTDKAKCLKSLRDLPTLRHYLYGGAQRDEDIKGLPAPSEARISGAIDSLVADYEEALSLMKPENGGEDSVGEDEGANAPWRILGMKQEKYDDFVGAYGLPEVFVNALQCAYRLERIFDRGDMGEKRDEIDYSPVTIMYCKLVESMLKEYHLPVYEKTLLMASTQVRKNEEAMYTFGEIAEVRSYIAGRITIGPFLFAIDERNKKANGAENIRKLATEHPGSRDEWKSHAATLKVISDIRNRSAHGTKDKRITLEDKQHLHKYLFDNGAFLRIIRLVRKRAE